MHPIPPAATALRGHDRAPNAGHKKAYFRHLRSDPDGAEAFLHDFRSGFTPIRDGDAEAFGATYVWGVTSNDAISELARDEVYAEEMGGLVVDLEDPNALDLTDLD